MNALKILPFAFVLVIAASCGKKKTVIKPEIRDINEAVYASGNIEPENQYTVYALADGTLAEKYVNEGDTISAYGAICKISNVAPQARLSSAEEIYRTAQKNYGESSPVLQELKNVVNSAKNKLINDSVNYFRYKKLFEEDAVKKSDVERFQLVYNNSVNDYAAAKQHYESTKAQLYVTLQNAESQYKVAQEDANNYVIKSDMNGRLYDFYKEKGEAVHRNEPIALIGDANKVIIRMNIDESDVERVNIGQEVLVQAETFGTKIFKAKVTKIYPMFDKRNQSYRIDAEFTDTLPKIFSGSSVEANIVVKQKSKALCIPKNVLVGTDSLYIKTDKGEEKIKITKGLENFEYVEVLGGIDANTEIIKK